MTILNADRSSRTSRAQMAISCYGNGSQSATNTATNSTSVTIRNDIVSVTINGVTTQYPGTRCTISNGRIFVDGVEQLHAGFGLAHSVWCKIRPVLYISVPAFVLWKLWKLWK